MTLWSLATETLGCHDFHEAGGRCFHCVFAPDVLIHKVCGKTVSQVHTSSCMKTT